MDHDTSYGNFSFFPWNTYEMLGHADSLQHERGNSVPSQAGMLTYQERGAALHDAEQQLSGTEISVGDPKLASLDDAQNPREKRAFIRPCVFVRTYIDGNLVIRIENNQRFAGKRRAACIA